MTESDIIKALECRIDIFSKSVLDLINRKNAEIERLEKELDLAKADKVIAERHEKDARDLFKGVAGQLAVAKSEAIKEFADRLKNIADKTTIKYVDDDKVSFLINEVDLDNLVKEMTENDFKE